LVGIKNKSPYPLPEVEHKPVFKFTLRAYSENILRETILILNSQAFGM
jgi:hypothetical protein